MIPERLRKAFVGITSYFCFILAVVTLGPLQFGFHLAELNAPQDVITCRRKDIVTAPTTTTTHHARLPDCIPMTEARFATVSSVYTVGGLIGALAAGPFCSRRGRREAMAITSFIFLAGSLTETFSNSMPILAVGRVLNGISGGASTVIVPLYISEIAPPASRGFFGAFTQITVNVGILLTQTLGFFLSHGSAWRFILGTGIAFALASLLGMLGVTESPAWLVTHKGETARARLILQRIRGTGVSIEDEVASWPEGGLQHAASAASRHGTTGAAAVPAEQQALLDSHPAASLSYEEEGAISVAPRSPRLLLPTTPSKSAPPSTVGFFTVVTHAHYRPALVAIIGIMFAQQVCGINSVIMYSVSLLNGMLPLNSALLTIIISAVNLVVTMLCAPLPDRLGRKTCLIMSVIGQGSSSLALAFSIVFGIKVLSAFSVLTFVAFFAVGLGPVPFILASELVGPEAVGATQSWALGANYVATFLVAQFFPLVNSALNARLGDAGWVYFLFAAFAAVSTAFFWLYVPETNGKRDADEVWGRTTHLD